MHGKLCPACGHARPHFRSRGAVEICRHCPEYRCQPPGWLLVAELNPTPQVRDGVLHLDARRLAVPLTEMIGQWMLVARSEDGTRTVSLRVDPSTFEYPAEAMCDAWFRLLSRVWQYGDQSPKEWMRAHLKPPG
jgi:hypothetical protein